MRKACDSAYERFIPVAKANECGCVYPMGVAEKMQDGDIFIAGNNTDNCEKNVLFWTCCGFAYLSNMVDEGFLEEISDTMLGENAGNGRRFLLMTRDQKVEQFFSDKPDILLEKRYLFSYEGEAVQEVFLPEGFTMHEIEEKLLDQISGSISPSLFWKDKESFLQNGKGYCITYGDEIAAWAFSAGVSSEEIDIGIETNPKFRKQGLASLAAKKMIAYTIGQGKKPVWACHCINTGSKRLAEKLGFRVVNECTIIKKK